MRFVKRPDTELLFQETKIVLHVDNRYRRKVLDQIHKIDDISKEYSIEVKKKRKGTEAPAQVYIWTLVNKIAEKRNQDPTNVYREYVIRTISKSTVYYETMAEAIRSKNEWEDCGIGWMVLSMTPHEDLVKCERVRGYTGWTFHQVDKFTEMLERELKSLNVDT